jgi:hypothetical protein
MRPQEGFCAQLLCDMLPSAVNETPAYPLHIGNGN